jgi:hypothetical protein
MDKIPLYVSGKDKNKYTNIYDNFKNVERFFFSQPDPEGYFGLFGKPFFRIFTDKTIEEKYYFPIIISISGISEVIDQHIIIPKNVYKDVQRKKCKILIVCPYEGWTWTYWQDLVDKIKNKYPKLDFNSFVFLNGNLSKSSKFKSVYFNFFERQCLYEDLNAFLYTGNDKIIEKHSRKHKFIYLNRRPHHFRIAAVSLLFNDRDNGLISLGLNGEMHKGYYETQESKFKKFMPSIFELYQNINLRKFLPLVVRDGINAEKDNPVIDRSVSKFYDSYLHIVAETYQDYSAQRTFFSEKIFKPIMFMQPFVIIGEAFALQNLKTLGYKTFDKFIDESYDVIVNDEERMYACIKSAKDFFNKSPEELNNILNEMLPILIHNISHLQYRTQTYDISIKTQLLELLNE